MITFIKKIFYFSFILTLGLVTNAQNNGPQGMSKSSDKVEHWTLDDVTKLAYEKNPDLRSALANYKVNSKAVLAAFSTYLPHLDVVGGVEQTTLPTPSAGSTSQIGIQLPYSSIVVSVSQTIFDFGKGLSEIESARANKLSAEQSTVAVKNALLLSVQRAFYGVIAGQKLVDSTTRGVDAFNENVRRTKRLVETGTRPSFDLTQANVELGKAKLLEIEAQNALDLAKIALVTILALPEETSFELIESPKDEQKETSAELNLKKLMNKALDYRPEVKIAEYNVESARHLLHRDIADYFPTISLSAFYGDYEPNYPVEIRNSYGGMVQFTWHAFDGLLTTAHVGESEAKLEIQQAQQEKEKDKVISEVARAYKQLVTAENKLSVSTESLKAAIENERLARKRYETNVSTQLELLVASSSLISAETAAIQATYGKQIALTELKTAVNASILE